MGIEGNKYAIGNHGGRPPVFSSPKEMSKKITAYFNKFEKHTITGLCLFLGFESRQSFYDYVEKEEFSYIVKRARLVIENGYEERLSENGPTGAIFALKNMGWADKQEYDITPNPANLLPPIIKVYSSNIPLASSEDEIIE